MALKIRDAGTLRTITKLTIRQAGVNRRIRTLKVMDGDALRTVAIFADPLSVSANNASGAGSGLQPTITTSTSTAQPSGGLGPYTYVWSLISNGGSDASTALNPTGASTAFRKTNVNAGETVDVWRVTVTDSVGNTAADQINATFSNIVGPN